MREELHAYLKYYIKCIHRELKEILCVCVHVCTFLYSTKFVKTQHKMPYMMTITLSKIFVARNIMYIYKYIIFQSLFGKRGAGKSQVVSRAVDLLQGDARAILPHFYEVLAH